MSTWSGRIVTVTGGTSFIGAAFADLLVRVGATVHLLVRADSDRSRLPLLVDQCVVHRCVDAAAAATVVRGLEHDLLIHCASMFKAEHAFADIAPMIEANIAYGSAILDALRGSTAPRVLNIGTTWQHFGGRAFDPVCLYAATKQAFESIIDFYVSAFGFEALTVQLADTYGPRDHRGKLISTLVRASTTGQTIELSPGEQKLDLLYIDDVIEGLLIGARQLVDGEIIGHSRATLSSGVAIPLREVVGAISVAMARPVPVHFGGRPYRAREVMEPHLGKDAPVGWIPKVSLADGIRRLLMAESSTFAAAGEQ